MNRKEKLDEMYFKALELDKEGDVAQALNLFRQGAELGDAGAQNCIGIAYDSGRGVEQNKQKAIEWFKRAWRNSKEPGYCVNVALTYEEVGKPRQALYWWRKAVASGDRTAALGFAKFLMKKNRSRFSEQIFDLLTSAAQGEEYMEISPNDKEEAQKLLSHFDPQRKTMLSFWFAAHIVMAVRFKNDPQTHYPVWENVVLIEAVDPEHAMPKAETYARLDDGDSNGSFTWGDRPAEWFFAGIRKLIACVDYEQRPTDGTEITYSELVLKDDLALQRFAAGESVVLTTATEQNEEQED